MSLNKKLIDTKKQWFILILTLLTVFIILIIGHQSFKTTLDTTNEEFKFILHQAYQAQQILISLIIFIIVSGAFYFIFISRKINEKLLKEVEKQTKDLKNIQNKLESIKNIGVTANSSLHLNKVLNDVLTGTLEITNASVGMIFLKDQGTNCLFWGASIGLSDAFVNDYKKTHIAIGEGLTGRIAQSGETIYIAEDSSHDPRIARPVVIAENLNSFIGVPIYAKDEIVGVMNILTRPPHVLNREEIHLISAIGAHIGSAIQNARLYEESTKAKELLKESEEKYRDLYDNAPDMYYSIDKDGIIIDCNKTGIEMLGYAREDIIGKPLTDFFTEKSKILFRDTFGTLAKNGILLNVQREFVRKDNSVLPASLNVFAEVDDKGNLIKTKTIARDISKDKINEKERDTLINNISKAKKEWETIFDSAFEFIVLIDKESNIQRCNKSFIRYINQPIDKILYTKFYNIFPYDNKNNNVNLEDYLNGNKTIEDIEVNTISGEWFYLSKKPIYDDKSNFLFAIIVARDITILKKTHQRLLNSETELKKRIDAFEELFIKLITVLVSALEAKSPWTKGHSENVANYAEELAKNLGLDENETKRIKLAGLLHDIGKIAVPDNLLDKNGNLTNDEREIINGHPLKGTKILEGIKQLEDVIPLIKSHHERNDGCGYPDCLKNSEIPVGSKILHLVDSFDAMTSNRPYRKNPGVNYAISEIKKYSGTQFDPQITDVFLKIISKKKIKK
ncbi:MAG: HD domain-containing phosphohydrolase [bacterium]